MFRWGRIGVFEEVLVCLDGDVLVRLDCDVLVCLRTYWCV